MDEITSNYNARNKYIHYIVPNNKVDMGLIQLGYHKCNPGYGYGPLIRDHFLLHFVKKGCGIFQLGNKTYKIVEGECFMIFPHQIAYYESSVDNPWEYYWIGYTGFNADTYTENAGFRYNHEIRKIVNENEIFGEFDKILAQGFSTGNNLLYKSLLFLIMHHLTITSGETKEDNRLLHKSTTKYAHDEYVELIIKIIGTSYQEKISIEKIADKLSIHRSYLSNLFKKETGQSIKHYLLTYRINKAMSKMLDKNKSISEIATETGFTDPLYFSRLFKQHVGYSPSEYRKNIL